jgi:hypothetical protein
MRYLFILILVLVTLSACAVTPPPTATPLPATLPPPPRPTLEFPTPTFDGTPFPHIDTFQVDNAMPKRGDTLTFTWSAQDAPALRIEIYDLDYFPSHFSRPPDQLFEHLEASGSMNITIPTGYMGTGWQVYLLANSGDKGDMKRIDLVFGDVNQGVRLNINSFSTGTEQAHRGETLTVQWDTSVTTRVSLNGVTSYDEPVMGYDDKLYLDIFAVYDGISGFSPLSQRLDNLHSSGSISFTIPDYPPEFTRVMFNLGLKTGDQDIIFDIQSVELMPSE